jgi:hypothetical protein
MSSAERENLCFKIRARPYPAGQIVSRKGMNHALTFTEGVDRREESGAYLMIVLLDLGVSGT